jgi:DNA-binding NtrC family response regulator
MTKNAVALVVQEDAAMREHLQAILRAQRIQTQCAYSCREVEAALAPGGAPKVIFTGPTLSDGTWREVLKLAGKAHPPAEVVLTVDEKGPYLDSDEIRLYLDAMEEGAFDFMVCPFAPTDIAYVFRRAIDDLATRGVLPN